MGLIDFDKTGNTLVCAYIYNSLKKTHTYYCSAAVSLTHRVSDDFEVVAVVMGVETVADVVVDHVVVPLSSLVAVRVVPEPLTSRMQQAKKGRRTTTKQQSLLYYVPPGSCLRKSARTRGMVDV